MPTPTGEHQGGTDLVPPPREPLRHAVRRRLRSVGRHNGLRHWLSTRGIPVLLGYAALFTGNGFLIGWRRAYDVSIGITSPADTSAPVPAWFLSVAGWLLVPGIVGAVAGYAVSNAITSRRTRPLDELFPEDDDG
ncbi:DUF6313 family protein [Actinomadura macrotermitis]|uniref:Uncharacterized protein n=1 Tax=Actinomadura macrotermitis TaxID=2585200 RepID=A0A7K0C1M6_9ACTN|nr:DUF6313 family protein [Actinomadura macrotermitis]MQY07300.1 hypothetical protein [Actinomadura macrotermitis]